MKIPKKALFPLILGILLIVTSIILSLMNPNPPAISIGMIVGVIMLISAIKIVRAFHKKGDGKIQSP